MDSRDDEVRVASLVSGVVSGVSRVLLGHPVDTLKVLQQTRQLRHDLSSKSSSSSSRSDTGRIHGLSTPKQPSSSTWMSRSVANVSLVYRGVVPPLITTGISTSISFFIYENARLSILNLFEPRTNAGTLLAIFASGTIAGSCLCMVTSPLENVKVIQQVSRKRYSLVYWLKALALGYHGASPYRAITANLVQGGIGRGFYLAGYAAVKSLEDIYRPKFSETLLGKLVAASGAGICGWLFTFPFDVIRSNMMADWERKRFKSTLHCAKSLYDGGGIRALYAGLGFTLIRAVPVACVALTSYDLTQTYLITLLQSREEDNQMN